MTKLTTDDLGQWVQKKQKKKRRQSEATVEFLAVKSFVVESMDAGYSLKLIWEYLVENKYLRSSYETFRTYVHRFIKKKNPVLAAKKTGEVIPEETPTKGPEKNAATMSRDKNSDDVQVQSKDKPKGITGFNFNSTPNKEDLI
ncbi:TraK family protein [Vibrio parahaemolyticus]|uniref:TraK family protein n=1 Tax=Vibrio parahaemolyticus TaxID=670 RepID=UPI00111C9B94|nr:TraK family protein [Vibrio parahaemolyticus]MDG2676327.1 TraK family protein [Vibrio parahaemolyticus]TOA86329.1 conjugal transfer protein TraK [Vibrio parahaemolyticus]HBH7899508.1 conjugal transfer protein TraK [Vibrio parahaemolyticus]HDZ5419554.1 conjugal transfer protein TraK [Vibrio harveyi]